MTKAEDGNIEQTEVTSDTNKIMLDNADPTIYVIYDKSTDIDPAKNYTYTVVVENDGRFKATSNRLSASDKYLLNLTEPTAVWVSDWNDLKWTFSASVSGTEGKAVSGIKDIKAYLLVTPTTQQKPKANEVIAQGTEITPARDTENVLANEFTFAKSALSTTDAKVFVVVTAKCDGYEDGISTVGEELLNKTAATN